MWAQATPDALIFVNGNQALAPGTPCPEIDNWGHNPNLPRTYYQTFSGGNPVPQLGEDNTGSGLNIPLGNFACSAAPTYQSLYDGNEYYKQFLLYLIYNDDSCED